MNRVTALDRLILALPKVELHIHLEGSIPPELALQLATRHGRSLPGMAGGASGLRQHYLFPSFREFVDMYLAISACLVTAADFAEITRVVAANLAAQNIVYAEVTFTPMTHVARGVDPEAMLAGLAEGRERALAEHGVEIAWVFDIVRCFADQAEPTLALALQGQRDGVIGLGFTGPESPKWPTAPFAPTFARAKANGLRSLPHAGEMSGPDSIRAALTDLQADRLGHGVRAVDDPALLEHLAALKLPLEVCPTSNIGIGLFPDLASHPLPQLLAAGLEVSLASDDPPMFATTLCDEFRRCAAAYAWDAERITSLAAAAVRHSYLPAARKTALLAQQAEISARSL